MTQPIDYSPLPSSNLDETKRKKLKQMTLVVCIILLILSILSYWRAQEISFTQMNSSDRGLYIVILNGITYINVSLPARAGLGYRMDEQLRSMGYEYVDFTNSMEATLFRFFGTGLYREPGRSVFSFPLPIPALIGAYFALRGRNKSNAQDKSEIAKAQ